jgi:hypothetical protein
MLNLHSLKLNTKDRFDFAIQQNLGSRVGFFVDCILHIKFAKFMPNHLIKLHNLEEALSMLACCK